MAEYYLVTLLILLTVAVLRGVVPWLAQKIALYGLHELRDRLYEVGRVNPWARDTLYYRDADYLMALYIHRVRDWEFQHCADCLHVRTRPSGSVATWRGDRLAYEAHAIFHGERRAVLSQLRGIVQGAQTYLWTRTVFGHPAVMLLSVLLVLGAIPYALIRPAEGEEDPGVPEKFLPRPGHVTRREGVRAFLEALLPMPRFSGSHAPVRRG